MIPQRAATESSRDLDPWLSPQKAAAYLDVEPETLEKWRAQGVGPKWSASFARTPRYRLSHLDVFMLDGIVSNTIQARSLRKKRDVPLALNTVGT